MTANNLKNRFFTFVQQNSTEIICAICFILVNVFLACMLIPTDSPIAGHDSLYHYLRVEALKYNIENNNLFSGIDYLYFGGGGYAGFAYPEIFLFIPALLRVAGVGISESMVIFLGICNALSYWFMFVFMRAITKSPVCGTIGAVLYVLSTYRIDNIITRFALGEVLAYVFWPLILYGLYDFIFGDFKKPYIIGFGFVGMLLSHTISTVLALGLCVIVSVIFIKRILKAPKKLVTLAVTAGCAVWLTAYYWLPLLELLNSCEMSVEQSAFHTVDYVIPFVGLFREIVHNGIAGMKFPVFLLCVPRVFLTRRSPVSKRYLREKNSKKRKDILVIADTFLIIGIVLAVLSTDLVPWEYLSAVLDFMQFPWRFFAPASILLIIAGTVYVFYIAKYTKTQRPTMLVVTAAALLTALVHVLIAGVGHRETYEPDYYTNNVSETYHVGMGEWLPRAANAHGKDIISAMGQTVLLSSGESLPCERENGSLTFELNESVEFATVPYIWYKGYEAHDENGNELKISMTDNGIVQVDLHGASGRITVEHKPTVIKIISLFISLAAVLALTAAAVILHRKRKRPALKD
ncbi:MAG: hypothetical protein J1F28_06400 [Oscillospiraceae bacterium]|nr:hypothetical protein [Oscillospiraceae bacterium]